MGDDGYGAILWLAGTLAIISLGLMVPPLHTIASTSAT